jgi:hypothetical protein
VTLKSLTTGVAAGLSAAAMVGAAAVGVTSIASGASLSAPQVQPVVFGAPMPMDPAPDLAGPLTDTVNQLGAGGSFAGKDAYIQGLGGLSGRVASSRYASLNAKGYFPLTATVTNIDQEGPTATATVSATTANGSSGTTQLSFVQGPSPTGWQVTIASLEALSSLG